MSKTKQKQKRRTARQHSRGVLSAFTPTLAKESYVDQPLKRQHLGFSTRKIKTADGRTVTAMVIKGTATSLPMVSVGAGTYNVTILQLNPYVLAQSVGTISFLGAISACFARFRFTRVTAVPYALGGTGQLGEVAACYFADAAQCNTTQMPSSSGGYNMIINQPDSEAGPLSLPLSLVCDPFLDRDFHYTARVAVDGVFSVAGAAEYRLEDQGGVCVGCYNGNAATGVYLTSMIHYELELIEPMSNSMTEVYTVPEPSRSPDTPDPEEKHDDSTPAGGLSFGAGYLGSRTRSRFPVPAETPHGKKRYVEMVIDGVKTLCEASDSLINQLVPVVEKGAVISALL